jgi:hypothetical protein
MTVAIDASPAPAFSKDQLSGISRAHFIDRWIYVFTAASLIAIVLAGFVPDSLAMGAAIDAGRRPPSPPILHVHAVLMGSFLSVLLAQTILVALGKRRLHMTLGIAGMILALGIVVSGFVLVPTIYHLAWNAALHAPTEAKQRLQRAVSRADNIQLLQFRAALLFSVFIWIAYRARIRDGGLHKRIIFLSVTAVLGAAIVRIHWLPTTMPGSPLTMDMFSWLALAPMFLWDLVRNRRVHRAYWIWAALYLPATAAVYTLWDTPWWHATSRSIMGV